MFAGAMLCTCKHSKGKCMGVVFLSRHFLLGYALQSVQSAMTLAVISSSITCKR